MTFRGKQPGIVRHHHCVVDSAATNSGLTEATEEPVHLQQHASATVPEVASAAHRRSSPTVVEYLPVEVQKLMKLMLPIIVSHYGSPATGSH